jgi:hypothetical protein
MTSSAERPADEAVEAATAGRFAGEDNDRAQLALHSPPYQAQAPPDCGPYLSARKVWERYDVTDRTLDRWIASPEIGFPQPLIVNNRRYFSEPELIVWERQRAGKAA